MQLIIYYNVNGEINEEYNAIFTWISYIGHIFYDVFMMLQQHEFDCLGFIDKEFDNVDVRNAVIQMVEAEMRTFKPNYENYLSYLPPIPPSRFDNSPALKAMYDRIASGQPNKEKISERRYVAEKPESALDNDVQAWRKAVQNAKSQIIHQENSVMNFQVSEDRMTELWLQQNSILEKTIGKYKYETDLLVMKVRESHKERKALQEAAQPELTKLTLKRDQSTMRRLQCEAAFVSLHEDLSSRGHSYKDYLLSRTEEMKREEDPNNAAYNSTVREYESVNVTGMDVDVEDVNDDEEEDDSEIKRARIEME